MPAPEDSRRSRRPRAARPGRRTPRRYDHRAAPSPSPQYSAADLDDVDRPAPRPRTPPLPIATHRCLLVACTNDEPAGRKFTHIRAWSAMESMLSAEREREPDASDHLTLSRLRERAGVRVARAGVRVARAGVRVARAGVRVARAGVRVARAAVRGRAGRGEGS